MNNYHKNVLVPSVQDTVELCRAVQERFLGLLESYLQIKGVCLIPPKSLDNAMIRWRTMAMRFASGDYRNSEEEVQSLREVAQWTVDENCLLRGQPPKKVNWG
jgi:hypothetical protein